MSVKKIMVVDDEPAIGRLLSYQLNGFGYEVCYVQDGLQALEQVLLERPDLILLDVMMPLVSGWDVCREVRTCSAVPIIMLTGKNADTDVVTGLQAGADDYVVKPFSVTQLQARIEAVMRRAGSMTAERRPTADSRRTNGGWVAVGAPSLAAPQQREPLPAAPVITSAPPLPLPQKPALSSAPHAPAEAAPIRRFGVRMREARQRRGISLYQAERDCRVRWEFLQAIEQENWSYLPRHQLRPAVLAYTGFLGMDQHEVDSRLPRQQLDLHMPAAALALVLMVLLVMGLTLL